MSEPSRHGFKEHGLMLYLPPSLYMALIKMQGDKNLGRSYAGLSAYTEGMHKLGYLNDEDYENFKARYSKKLIPEATPKPVTLQEQQVKKEHDSLARAFGAVIEQWNLSHVDPNWKQKWLIKAEKHKDTIPQAKQLLDMVARRVMVSEPEP